MKKAFWTIGILFILLVGCGFALILNQYLKETHRFAYATGTKDKAFLNGTWKMSSQEIERANNTVLTSSPDSLSLLFVPDVTNKNRFKEMIQKDDVFLWGHKAEVQYSFFDNQLYSYYIPLTVYDRERPFGDILKTLEEQFGEGKRNKETREDIVASYEWETANQKIGLWMGRNETPKDSYYVGINAKYMPFFQQIEEIAQTDKKKLF